MAATYEKRAHRPLERPVLVVALEGWIDAGLAASGAASTLLSELDTETVASFDADELLDHRARRPVLHLVAGVSEGLSWPSIELLAAQDLAGRDLDREAVERRSAGEAAAQVERVDGGIHQAASIRRSPSRHIHRSSARVREGEGQVDRWCSAVSTAAGAIHSSPGCASR